MNTTTTAPLHTTCTSIDAELKVVHEVCPTCGSLILAEDYIAHIADCREALR